MKTTLDMKRCKRLAPSAPAIAFLLLASCDLVIHQCDTSIGVCPLPDVGVVLDDGRFVKRVWIEDVGVGTAYEQVRGDLRPHMCLAELDTAEGMEVLLHGHDGLAVMSNHPEAPETLAAIPLQPAAVWSLPLLLIDVDGDGNVEFLRRSTEYPAIGGRPQDSLLLWNHSGELVWRRAIAPFLDSDGTYVSGGWTAGDVDADGVLEFAVSTSDGAEIFMADGTDLVQVGGGLSEEIAFANLDGHEGLELVTRSAGTVNTWAMDGTRIATFEADWKGIIARVSPDDVADRIYADCDYLDAEGQVVASLTPNEWGYCGAQNTVSYWEDRLIDPCEKPDATDTVVREVRFTSDAEPYRVEVSYSYQTRAQTPVAGAILSIPLRAALRIYDPGGALVYHEVIASGSGPGSIAVIPSDVEGQELLLVADDTRILAYELRSEVRDRQ